MSMGVDAYTLASHVVLILSAVGFFGFVSVLGDNQLKLGGALMARRVGIARIVVFSFFIVERLYYVCARFLTQFGVNLWGAHPAPEVLSFGFAAAIYVLIWALLISHDEPILNLKRVAAGFGVALLTVWCALVAALH